MREIIALILGVFESMIHHSKVFLFLVCASLWSCGGGSEGIMDVASNANSDAGAENTVKPPVNRPSTVPTDEVEDTAASEQAKDTQAMEHAQAQAAKAAEEAAAAETEVEAAKAAQAAAEAALAAAQAEAEAAKAAQAEAEAQAQAALAAQAEAEAQAQAAQTAQVQAEAAAQAAQASEAELAAAVADPTKYVFNGQIYNRRAVDDTDDCDSSIECSNGELCLNNDTGVEENQPSGDDLFPHNGDPSRPAADLSGNEQCR